MNSTEQIEAQAAAWLVRRDGEAWTEDDQSALASWLEQSVAQRVAFLRLEHAWSRADRLGALQARSPLESGAFDPVAEEAAVPVPMPPTATKRMPTRWRAMAGLAAAVLLVATVLLTDVWRGPAALETAVGGHRSDLLADGSRIELNTDSRVRAAVSKPSRTVWLDRGEAFFEVAHDPAHPFVVHAGGCRITVLGTRFSVRRDRDRTVVVVAEGRVRIDREGAGGATAMPTIVTGGEVAVAEDNAIFVTANPGQDVASLLGWRDGQLLFEQVTLQEAATEFNRYNRRHFVISDPGVAAMRIGGRFGTHNVDGFAALLRDAMGLSVRDDGEEINISK